MKALIQRVTEASVTIDGSVRGRVGKGLCILLGVGPLDTGKEVKWLADKLVNLRIFEDNAGKMNLSLKDISGEALIISQFTLYGDCSSGRRPSFTGSAPPDMAKQLYKDFISEVEYLGISAQCGVFGADMKVALVNDGPVTFMVETP